MIPRPQDSVLVLVDIQPRFMIAIHEAERVVRRTKFLAECARLLGVPVLATVQNSEKMGGLDPELAPLVDEGMTFPKMAFSAFGASGFAEAIGERTALVLAGVETPICVAQTAYDAEMSVVLAYDAISARSSEMHERALRDLESEAYLRHTEAIVYGWMRTAEHPRFRDVLHLLKSVQVPRVD